MRGSHLLAIFSNLVDKGVIISVHVPQGVEEARKLLPERVDYQNDVYECIQGAVAFVLMSEWNESGGPGFKRIGGLMSGDVFIDLCNICDQEQVVNGGFSCHCVGRSSK